MFPDGLEISIPAPNAAIFGSSSMKTSRAPHFSAASRIAFFSTNVILVGQQIMIRGCESIPLIFNELIKCFNIISVAAISAITPSFIGRTTSIFPGVRPSI